MSFVIVSLLQLGGVLMASNSLIVAVPGAVTAPGVVSFGGVPIMGGISRTLCSGRGSGSDQGATAMAGRASTGCLAWVAEHPQLVLLGRGQAGILLIGVVLVLNDTSIKFCLAGQILFAAPSTLATTTATATEAYQHISQPSGMPLGMLWGAQLPSTRA